MPFGPRSLYLALSAVLLIVGILDGRRVLRRHPGVTIDNILHRKPRILLGITLTLVLVVPVGVIHSSATHRWLLPLPLQAVAPQLFWGGVLAVSSYLVGLGGSVGILTRHPKWKMLLVAALCLEGSLILTLARNQELAAPHLLAEVDDDGVIRQTRSYSSAAAATANLLARLGRPHTEQEMAELLGTTIQGTSPAQVYYGLEKLGLSCKLREIPVQVDTASNETYHDYRELEPPAILFVNDPSAGPEGHAVLYWANDERGNAIVLDSLHGRWVWDYLSLGKVWNGHAIECHLPGWKPPEVPTAGTVQAETPPDSPEAMR